MGLAASHRCPRVAQATLLLQRAVAGLHRPLRENMVAPCVRRPSRTAARSTVSLGALTDQGARFLAVATPSVVGIARAARNGR